MDAYDLRFGETDFSLTRLRDHPKAGRLGMNGTWNFLSIQDQSKARDAAMRCSAMDRP
jgi:hypothetical protein